MILKSGLPLTCTYENGIMNAEVIGMFKINPYRPGAGLMPTYLAGRDADMDAIRDLLDALKLGIPTQSVIFSGLRGVGKTVLINKLQEIAEEKGIFCKHIEVEERKDFISQIASCSQAFLRQISTAEKFKSLIQKPLDAIKSLIVSFDPDGNTFSLSLQERELYRTSNLTQSLTDVFTALGETAYKTESPLCFFIDEIQYMKPEELGALIAALHRTNQLGYPLMLIGAGLPKIYVMLSEAKSYSERLFIYKEIDSLDRDQSIEAIRKPAEKLNVSYTDEAVGEIIDITKGYPFFIQQLCQIVFQNTDGKRIDEKHVESCIPEFFHNLDNGFFKVRYERCSEADKKFIFAMVSCDKLPCTISNIAQVMHKTVSAISTSRAQLINKGIIYAVRYKELDFTVPEFSGFIRRLPEFGEWEKENQEEQK